MSNPKHTPGPWRVSKTSEDLPHHQDIVSIRGPTGCLIGEVYNSSQEDLWDTKDEPNARLIAAAPLLFEALKAIERLIDAEILIRNPGLEINQAAGKRTLNAMAMLTVAIAKAEGK